MTYEVIAKYIVQGKTTKKINEDCETLQDAYVFAYDILNQSVWCERSVVIIDESDWQTMFKANATANPDSIITVEYDAEDEAERQALESHAKQREIEWDLYEQACEDAYY